MSDLYVVYKKSLIADYDKDTILNLYQPIIGYKAVCLYLTLQSEFSYMQNSLSIHENLLNKMHISTGDFIVARQHLEAIGLLKTYLENNNNYHTYSYELYAPKTPNDFFNDPLLYGQLIKKLGEKLSNQLKNIYVTSNPNEGKNDVSSTYAEVFQPNFDAEEYKKAILEGTQTFSSRISNNVDGEFDLGVFFQSLSKISHLTENSFTNEEIKTISKLASLYGVGEESASNIVKNCFDLNKEKGNRVDIASLKRDFINEINFNSIAKYKHTGGKTTIYASNDLASKINLLESVSPKEFLSIIQNGTMPSPSDLYLVGDLATKYGLKNAVINVVLDYVLTKKNNILSRPFAEKIASSLARSQITTAIDAMNYINENCSYKKAVRESNEQKNAIEVPETLTQEEEKEFLEFVDEVK